MSVSIRAAALGVALASMTFLPLSAHASALGKQTPDQVPMPIHAEPDPVSAPRDAMHVAPIALPHASGETHFVWTPDFSLSHAAPVGPMAADPDVAHPGDSVAVPLPPAAWTGLSLLGALGAITVIKRLRQARLVTAHE